MAANPRSAHAQAADFATCSPGTVASTSCSASTKACCKQPASVASAFLTSGTDYAVIVPLDYCHQAGSASPTTGAAPTWCSKQTGSADAGMTASYGLVYRLMQAGIPVYWIVNPSKTPPALGSTNGASVEVTTDIDAWVLDSSLTLPPATATTALTACGVGCTPPVKHISLTSAGVMTIDAAYTYDKKQFPIRGSAFMIKAADRANFNKFLRRQAPYASWAAGRSCGAGSSCQDFSMVDMFEIQPTARLGWTDFTIASPYNVGFRGDELPLAATLDYTPPKVSRIGPGGVSQKWLGSANLEDTATAACHNGVFTPADAVVCDMTEANIAAGDLVNNNFGWLWLDHWKPACGATMTAVRTFLTHVPYVRAAGNVMGIADAVDSESCPNQQLLGAEVAGAGLASNNGSAGSAFILRYPQSLYMQWGDADPDFANGQGGNGFDYWGSGIAGYNPAFTGASNTLHRLTSVDRSSGSNTVCLQQTSSATCDVQGGASGDNTDMAVYGRFNNIGFNGIVFYLTGTQIHQHTSELRVLLNSLIATPLGTVGVEVPATIEVSRASPVITTVSNVQALVQGTSERVNPMPDVPTITIATDAGTFTFPYAKGHVRAIATTNEGTTATKFEATQVLFDAANGIPAPTYAGCSHFTSNCRTVFTTTQAPTNGVSSHPPNVFFDSSKRDTLGPLMASNLTSPTWDILLQRVLAGIPSGNSFVPALGAVDRSTVAVIQASTAVGTARPTMVYFGASDGMLHAACASVTGPCDKLGRELWAYVPRVSLPDLRYNTARVDGSPRVVDSFGDFFGTGKRSWHTILTFQTGSGDMTSAGRTPAVYALDVTDPASPVVLWEHTVANVANRGAYELGVGLTLAAGPTVVGNTTKQVTFAQTNNGGTAGAGSVVTAIDTETGQKLWQTGYTYPAPHVAGHAHVPGTGIPGGAVAVDRGGKIIITDLVVADLYGSVWELDPATGKSRYTTASVDAPLFQFSTDYHPIGAKPSIYSKSSVQYAMVVSGGYADPADTVWGTGASQFAIAVSLSTPAANATLTENSAATYEPVNISLGTDRSYAQALVVGNEVFVTADSADVNGATYGTAGSTGKVYRYNLSTSTASTAIVISGGAGSVVNGGTALFIGSSNATQQLATPAISTVAATVDTFQQSKTTRKLWLRTR
jgi:hypothetical protein